MSQFQIRDFRDNVTRRSALSTLLVAAGCTRFSTPAISSQSSASNLDPAIVAWNAWYPAHCDAAALCRRQQRLETLLARTVGFPRGPDLATHQQRWDQADRRMGYSVALLAEKAAWQEEARFAEILFAAPARSFAGAIAKLDALIAIEAPSPTDDEPPWPQLRNIHADLERIADALNEAH